MRQHTALEKSSQQGLWRGLPTLCLCLAMILALAPRAQAGFLDIYPLNSFTLTNSPNTQLTNGTAVMQGQSLVFTGGNSGSGEPGTSDLLTTALAASQIQFFFSYSSLDARNLDSAGYLLNGLFFQLATASGASGTVQFNVTQGESFGFRLATADNQFEPGVLAISSVGAAATPEPGTGPVTLLAIGAALVAIGLRSARNSRLETRA
jgi:hypothetical protein